MLFPKRSNRPKSAILLFSFLAVSLCLPTRIFAAVLEQMNMHGIHLIRGTYTLPEAKALCLANGMNLARPDVLASPFDMPETAPLFRVGTEELCRVREMETHNNKSFEAWILQSEIPALYEYIEYRLKNGTVEKLFMRTNRPTLKKAVVCQEQRNILNFPIKVLPISIQDARCIMILN